MAATASSAQIDFNDITHVIIDAGYGARINEHIPDVQEIARGSFDTIIDTLFVYDPSNMPHMYVPDATPQKRADADKVWDLVSSENLIGPVCFTGFAREIAFSIIEILATCLPDIITIKRVTRVKHIVSADRAINCIIIHYDSDAQ